MIKIMKSSKKLMSVISFLLIMIITASFFTSTAMAAMQPSEARDGVVVVISETGTSYGSGFAIGKQGEPVEYIVTNNHIVEGNAGHTTATVSFSLASNDNMLANIYYYNAEKDIAILKLPEATSKRKPLVVCPMEYVDINDTFSALGYPSNQITDWPKYNTDDITITKGGIKKADRLLGMDVYMLDLTITNGNSGGPLINSDGEVVGINSFGLGSDNYAIVSDELLSVIDKDKIPLTLHTKNSMPLVLIFSVIGIIIVVFLLVIVLLMRKKSRPQEQYIPEPVSEPMPVQPTMPAPQPKPAPQKPSARIAAVGGTLNGRKYSIVGSVKIGRDSSKCAIDFPVNTQGISAVHCEVTFDGSVCYVKDLDSSYGTYSMDGTKLQPNVPLVLKSGDKFYLAGPNNTFEVRY